MGQVPSGALVCTLLFLLCTGGHSQTLSLPATTSTATTAAVSSNKTAPAAPVTPNVDISDFATPSTGAVKADPKAILTTKSQTSGPTIIVDGAGSEVIFKGIGWYGFNIGLASLGNLSAGVDAVSNDFKQVTYRMRMLGFNSIRVAFAFDSTWGINSPPVNYTGKCKVPEDADIMATLIPGTDASTTIKSNSNQLPPLLPPEVEDGICNADWPQDSTYQRFIWVIDYLISETQGDHLNYVPAALPVQGFYVMLDFHSNRYGDSLAAGNESLYDLPSWVQSWVALIKSVLDNVPAAHGRLLIDLINEPDGYSLTWEKQGKVPALGDYYISAIDALYKVCPGCLMLIEGGGQATFCGVNWGNGFLTDASIVKGLDLSTPTDFFNTILTKPWLNQVVLAPHLYCPEVSGATDCFSGKSMYDSLDKSYGYLTVAPGWCQGSACHVFPVILDEFGSTLNNKNETSCMASIIQYANGAVNAKTHASLSSWFFWSWQPDSAGTGGIVQDDWRTIVWDKIGLLTGGTKNWANGLGLLPWYLTGFSDLTPLQTNTSSKAIQVVAKAPTPAAPPVFAPPTDVAFTNAGQQDTPTSSSSTQTPTPTVAAAFINNGNSVVSRQNNNTAASGTVQTFATTSQVNSAPQSGNSLSKGALAGIIVAGVVLLAAVFAAAVLYVKLRNPRVTESFTPSSTDTPSSVSRPIV